VIGSGMIASRRAPAGWTSSCLLLLVLGAAGCDSTPSAAQSLAASEEKKTTDDATTQKRTEEIRKKREADEKAKQEAAAARLAALDAACVLPPGKPPKKLDALCGQVADAHDGFMQRNFADDKETLDKWNAAKGTQTPMTIAMCRKTGNIEAALCQRHALQNAGPELRNDVPDILRTCIDKFAKPKGDGQPQ